MSASQPSTCNYFVNPNYLSSCSNNFTSTLNPVTQEPLDTTPSCSQAEIQAVISVAATAQKDWCRVPVTSRAQQLKVLAKKIEHAIDHNWIVARLLSDETGLPRSQAIHELSCCPQIFQHYAKLIMSSADFTEKTKIDNFIQETRYEPYGVSVHILSAKHAIFSLCKTVAMALATGNSCIIKPARSATSCSLKFMEHFKVLLPGLICCIPGNTAVAQLLIQSPKTQVIVFSGSIATGNAVSITCTELMKPCVIETERSEAVIISKNSSLRTAATYITQATNRFHGQSSHPVKRIFVQHDAHDQFFEILLNQMKNLDHINSHTIDHTYIQIRKNLHRKIIRIIDDALSKGASLLAEPLNSNEQETGHAYKTIFLTGVTTEMEIFHEDDPWPIAIIVQGKDFDHLLQLQNDSPSSCRVSVFCKDTNETTTASEKLETDSIWINPPLITEGDPSIDTPGPSQRLDRFGYQDLDAFRRIKRILNHYPEPLHSNSN